MYQTDGLREKEIAKKFPQYKRRTINRNMKLELTDRIADKRQFNGACKANGTKKIKKKKYQHIPLTLSVYLRIMHQEFGTPGKELIKKYRKYSPANVYKHMVKPLDVDMIDNRKNNPGRPAVFTHRDRRRILGQIPKLRPVTDGDFTVGDIRKEAGVEEDISTQTVSRVLWEDGYALRNKRRKGVLTADDLTKRLKYAKEARKNLPKEFWTETLSFYFDGSGFTHKYNPCIDARRSSGMTWRKRREGESFGCTGKGKKEGSGGRVVHFMVAISYNNGVVLCEQMTEQMNGSSFANFVQQHFPNAFKKSINPKGKIFLQDGDPSQNSAEAMKAICKIGATKFSIPARSPDLNPIENFFHLTKRKLKADAISDNITRESYPDFVTRVKKTMEESDPCLIDKILRSMSKRIDLIIKKKGQRLKY